MKGLYEMDKNTQRNNDIKINKKMRTWNKYKNYVIAAIGVLAVIILVIVIVNSCSKGDNDDNNKNTEKVTQNNTTQETISQPDTQPSTEPDTQEETTAQETQGTTAKVYTTNKTVAKEDFTSQDFYTDSVFLGDAITSGIEYYGNLSSEQVIAEANITSDKALSLVDQVAAKNPSRLFIMLGVNELNYPRTASVIANNYKTLLDELKSKLPASTQIYIVSVLPITKSYESKTNVRIEKNNLDELNEKLKAMVETDNISYVDISSAFKDGSGYLNETVTSNGLNLNSAYYGFMLNTIAEMLK